MLIGALISLQDHSPMDLRIDNFCCATFKNYGVDVTSRKPFCRSGR
jgi:hypothetical protein